MSQPLGRVLDPEELERSSGPRGRLAVDVPADWAGQVVEVVVPPRVTCARCDGGGCDACSRSGALRVPGTVADRSLSLRVPTRLGEGVALRVSDPVGAPSDVEQLVVEIRPGDRPSANCRRALPPVHAARGGAAVVALLVALIAFFGFVLAIASLKK